MMIVDYRFTMYVNRKYSRNFNDSGRLVDGLVL